jgi:predicted nucleic acid-binding protein
VELIDSSAWIEYLRDTGSAACEEVDRLYKAAPADVATTEPVIMEVLAGATSEPAAAQLRTFTSGLRLLPVDPALDYHDAAAAFRAVRAAGRTVRSMIDCLIAAVAVRTEAIVVHRDRDFDVLATALPGLRVRSYV